MVTMGKSASLEGTKCNHGRGIESDGSGDGHEICPFVRGGEICDCDACHEIFVLIYFLIPLMF